MRHSLAAFPLVFACVATGCAVTEENPFVGAFRMQAPSAGCDVLFSSNLHGTRVDAALDLYCLDLAGGAPERLTYCAVGTAPCSFLEAAAAYDGNRLVARQIVTDADDDGLLSESDGVALAYVDLARGATATLVPRSGSLFGLDWSPTADIIVYSAAGSGGLPDLFGIDLAESTRTPVSLTASDTVAERQPRFDISGNYVLHESAASGANSVVWVSGFSGLSQALTAIEPEGTRLTGTPYFVGAHANPMTSSDNQNVVFRRLIGLGNAGRGSWELLTASTASPSEATVVVAGAAFRSAPDWGREGILFSETDPATGKTSLLLVDAAGAQRRTLLTIDAAQRLESPRWLHRAR